VRRALVVAISTLSVIFLGTGPSRADVAADAIFRLVVVTHEGPQSAKGTWKSVQSGTAFFVSDDGKAVTNSHVVYRVQRDPERYRLLAIVGKELYSASVVCASSLPYDPTANATKSVPSLSRDAAEVRVAPLNLPWLDSWGYIEYGTFNKVASAHWGSLPRFEALTTAGDAVVGDRVEIRGFGFQSVFLHPQLWTADGVVTGKTVARDGTEILEIESTLRAQPGNSGSPVLSADRRVVGLWTWYSLSHPNLSRAQSAAVVAHPCA
jgi:S1-C subfamily serine protease